MSRSFISGCFYHKEDDDDDDLYSSCSTSPRTSTPDSTPTRKSCKSSTKNVSKNPYSNRGLEKFSALLADIEEKKQKIYAQIDSEKITLVRFVYSNSNDVVPIVIKSKEKDQNKLQEEIQQDKTSFEDKYPITPSTHVEETCLEPEKKAKKIKFSWENYLGNPSYYVPAAILLIMVLLTVFSRSTTILFTSIGWYMVPTITGNSLKLKKIQRKKKENSKSLNDKKTDEME